MFLKFTRDGNSRGKNHKKNGPPTAPRRPLRMTRAVYDAIRGTVGARWPETGGLLAGRREDGVVTFFHFDRQARRSGSTYEPDVAVINRLLADELNPRGIYLLGFVHSHPFSCGKPSPGDLDYAKRILLNIPELRELLLPIVLCDPRQQLFELAAFAVTRRGPDVELEELELRLVEEPETVFMPQETSVATATAAADAAQATEIAAPPPETPLVTMEAAPRVETPALIIGGTDLELDFAALAGPCPTVTFGVSEHAPALTDTFQRVRTAYDLGRLASARVVCVGAGGAAGFIEDLARAGVGEFVLLDHDVVTASNLATQQTYRRDLGRPKVECLAERIRDINPHAAVIALRHKLDELTDAEFGRLAAAPLRHWTVVGRNLWGIPGLEAPVKVAMPPALTLLCGMTDDFYAQARVNRLALQFGLPSLCAQVYARGGGLEVTFTCPGVTPACHRCALRSRYEAYLQNGFENDVTADGTPIFATARLNALKGHLALALLHHGTGHPRWDALLQRIGPRNLAQVRLDPDLPLPAFQRVFGGGDAERILCDETIWLPQQPDGPVNGLPLCPDCGGTGDLRAARGSFADTRILRR